MRILHTADWHLGKYLDGIKNSRLDEQEKFIDELIDIVEEKNIQLVIIAGDIYDNSNPPARAERLFYKTLKRLSAGGERTILIIAGNHDNPERLAASNPLALEQGIIILGTPKATISPGSYGSIQVAASIEGALELKIGEERVAIVTLPYPSEKRLNEIFIDKSSDEERQSTYSDRIKQVFSELSGCYREDTINIAISHIYVVGGESSDSERQIELGGSLAVRPEALPEKAQYIALGHLHRPQRVKGISTKAYYSGSPIQYSKSEIGYSKCVYLIDVKAGEEANVEEIYLKNYKPIEIWKCKGVEEALEKCKANSDKDSWVYIEIETEEYISQEYIKQMNEYKKDIVEILPKIVGQETEEEEEINISEKSILELFKDFYLSQRGVEPKEDILKLFSEIAYSEGENE
ncbi:exonuclease SbcCD subunit D [Clostridium sp. 19966]|uniref:exonuclease SbcCD subunit D n=1 Tax=Clostridium sp. 19966 TaxID=2768166 RepID=UPI0028DDB15E|nr:exonuclease SbcCD subunit D [Clostridium sp. 19966]MDT8718582.1 exonuclease SbcCD subunit D [Clostridium sp. 19966]